MPDEPEGPERPSRLESLAKHFGLLSGLTAAFLGIHQFWQSNVQNARELRWKQAEVAREMMTQMMADEGWKAMEMMDWQDAGRDCEVNGQIRKCSATTLYAA